LEVEIRSGDKQMATSTKRITGGSLSVFRNHGPVFTLSGKRFAVRGGADPGNVSAETGTPYGPGDVVSLNSRFAGELTLGSGAAAIRGTVYQRLFYTGELNFSGGTVTVPSEDSQAITKNAPFTLSGSLNGYVNNPFVGDPGEPIFSFLLSGEGMATLQLSSFTPSGGNELHEFTSLVYTFHRDANE
jgi:hypothetical protein